MKKTFATILVILTAVSCAASFVGCSTDTTYTYDSIRPIELYVNGTDCSGSGSYDYYVLSQSIIQYVEYLLKDHSIKITEEEIILISDKQEKKWKYYKRDYKLMIDMNDFMSTMDENNTNNYLIYLVKEENRLYFMMEVSMIDSGNLITVVVTGIYKK